MANRLLPNSRARWGFGILVLFAILAIGAEFIAPYSPSEQRRSSFNSPPLRDLGHPNASLTGVRFLVAGDGYRWLGIVPSNRHLFGTDGTWFVFLLGSDDLGRDIFSRLVYGARVSLFVGLLGVIISFGFGIFLGGVSGFWGGWLDQLTMRGSELFMALPTLYLLLTLRSVFPKEMSSTVSFFLIVAILSFVNWGTIARVIRGMVLSLREQQFVEAAQALGASRMRVLWLHVLPNAAPFLIAQALLTIPFYILGEIALSFLGLGIQEPNPSWGSMLSSALSITSMTERPWILAPGAAIFFVVLAFNLLGEGLNDALSSHPALPKEM